MRAAAASSMLSGKEPGVKRFLILCGILALILLMARALPAGAGDRFSLEVSVEDDFRDGGGRTARRHFFDHAYRPPARRRSNDWRAAERPGVSRSGNEVLFSYRDRDYDEVWLLTDADDWEQRRLRYNPDEEAWETTVRLEPGVVRYQFRVRRDDGTIRDRTDPTNPTRRRDPDRGWVSQVEISAAGDVVLKEIRERQSDERLDRYDLELVTGIGADYQRVDGFFLRFSPYFQSRDPWAPAIHSTIGYGFSSEQGSGRGYFIQPLTATGRVRAVFSGYDYSDYTDRTGVGDLENSLATLAFREDSRDWYRRKGLSIGVELEEIHYLLVRAEFRSDSYETMPRTVIAGWGGRGDFVPNPEIDDGLMRSVMLRARWGNDYTHLWMQYENGLDSIFSSAFDYSQLIVQGRVRWRVGWSQTLDLRTRFGWRLAGELPVQKQFVAGGLGTVRGYEYQRLYEPVPPGEPVPYGGDQIGLINVEYALGVHEEISVGLFFDSGMVHEKTGGLRLGDFRSSMGVGLILAEPGDSSLRLDFIQALEADARFLVQGRLTRPF